MASIILPLLVLNIVPETEKSTYLGIITMVGLVLAIIVQPLAGAVSDRSRFRWGRRRPYILAGSLFSILLLITLDFANSLAAVLALYCLLQVSSNIAHGPWQGFIPDLVPEKKRGLASGVKSVMETLGAVFGIQVAGFLISDRFKGEESTKLLLALVSIASIVAIAMMVTILSVKEKPATGNSQPPLSMALRDSFRIDTRIRSSFVFFLVSRLLFLMPLIGLRTFGLYYFRDVAAVSDPVASAADLTIAIGVCLLLVGYPAGYLSDRIGRGRIVSFSCVIGALGFALLLFFPTYNMIMVAGGLVGIANGAFMSANWAMATDLVEEGAEARYLGLTNLATGGACVLTTMAGPAIDFFNKFASNLGYEVVIAICIVLFIASAVLLTRVKARSEILQVKTRN